MAIERPIFFIQKLDHGADLPLPGHATSLSAGLDLYCASRDSMVLAPMERALIPTGISIALPPMYEAQIRPRSGLAIRNGITVLNAPGTIDADYRGEVQVIMINLSVEPFTFTRGMRFAQMVIARHERVHWQEVSNIDEAGESLGRSAGFGSTGI